MINATDVVHVKIIVICVILIVTLVFALAPLWVAAKINEKKKKKLMSVLSFFTAGVFLGAGMMHLLPDSSQQFHRALVAMNSKSFYPWVYFIASLGFVVVWAVDLLVGGHDSGQTVAVAVAANKKGGAAIHKLKMKAVSTYGFHRHGPKHNEEEEDCCLIEASPRDGKPHTATRVLYSGQSYSSFETPKLQPSEEELPGSASSQGQNKRSLTAVHFQWMESKTQHEEWTDENTCLSDCDEENTHTVIPQHKHPTTSQFVMFPDNNKLLPLVLAALLSLHSFIAGMALGVKGKLDEGFVATLIAILGHKAIEAVALGVSFVKEGVAMRATIGVIFLYAFMTPLGISFGILITQAMKGPEALMAQGICQAFASGSFLYLTMHSVSEVDPSDISRPLQIIAISIGVLAMASIAVWV